MPLNCPFNVALDPCHVSQVYAVVLGIVSLCIIFGETTIPFRARNLSPFSQMIMNVGGEFPVQLLVLLPLVRGCCCRSCSYCSG